MNHTIEQKDYYGILGIDKGATKEEIKKAYRKLAMLHHPDKVGDKGDNLFKKINEAYTVLSDDEKKQIYDTYGSEGLYEFENSPFRNSQVQLRPLVVEVECNLFELYNGTQKTVQIKRTIISGNLRNPDKIQKAEEDEDFTVNIEPFTVYGERIIEKNKGNRHQTEDIHGDLFFIIVPEKFDDENKQSKNEKNNHVADYNGYTLEELNLHYELKISLSEALMGFKLKFKFLDSKEICMSTAKITKPGTIKVIPGLGFKKNIRTPFGSMNRIGHLYVHFAVEFPDKLNAKQVKYIAAALGVPRVDKSINNSSQNRELTIYKVEDLDDPPTEDNDNHRDQQTIFVGPGMSGMSGMSGMPDMGNGESPECKMM